jgi:hypothetical protein
LGINANKLRQTLIVIGDDGRAGKIYRSKMKIPGLRGREAGDNGLRKKYEDLKRRIEAADFATRSAYFNHIRSTYRPVSEGYALASSADRERILNEVREVSRKLWEAGNRAQALGLGVIMLNIESQLLEGDDAAFVRAGTEELIREAMA